MAEHPAQRERLDDSVSSGNKMSPPLGKAEAAGGERNEGGESCSLSHRSYLYVSLATSLESSTRHGARPRSTSTIIPPSPRLSQSRPSSPPPPTQFPPQRRPSISLPPSPNSLRAHRASLPSQPFGLSVPSLSSRSATPSPMSSHVDLRPRTPTPPPISRRSPSRRSARTPSPRPPLPPQDSIQPPAPPQQPPPPPNRNRHESQPYKMKMRGR